MLRLTKIFKFPMLQALQKEVAQSPRTLFIVAQPRLMRVGRPAALALRMRSTTTTTVSERPPLGSTEEKKKVTPLGWVLLLIPITTFGLGCWQTKRKAWKEQLIQDLEEKTTAVPVPLPEDLASVAKMEYRRVTVHGRFLHDKEMLLGPRAYLRPDAPLNVTSGLFSQRDEGNGYHVVTPFKLAGRDETILVNRGWVPRRLVKPETRAQGQVLGEVELTGVVRTNEAKPQFATEHRSGDIFLYRDLGRMCARSGAAPVFLDVTYECTPTGGPVGGQTRVALRNDHMSYLVTWFGLSVATSYLWYRQILKRIPY